MAKFGKGDEPRKPTPIKKGTKKIRTKKVEYSPGMKQLIDKRNRQG